MDQLHVIQAQSLQELPLSELSWKTFLAFLQLLTEGNQLQLYKLVESINLMWTYSITVILSTTLSPTYVP